MFLQFWGGGHPLTLPSARRRWPPGHSVHPQNSLGESPCPRLPSQGQKLGFREQKGLEADALPRCLESLHYTKVKQVFLPFCGSCLWCSGVLGTEIKSVLCKARADLFTHQTISSASMSLFFFFWATLNSVQG